MDYKNHLAKTNADRPGNEAPVSNKRGDGLYFQVPSDRQTTEREFDDLLRIAEHDGSGRDWNQIREALKSSVIVEHQTVSNGGTVVYRVVHHVAEHLARQFIYVEQGRSSKLVAEARPLFERMKRDAAGRKFDRLLVSKVSRLGRNIAEVIATVYELADSDVTVYPVKSQAGPINSTIGRLLWAIQVWHAEMEIEERSEVMQSGQPDAGVAVKRPGRPRVIFDREAVVRLRDAEHRSWLEIEKALGVSSGSIRRAYHTLKGLKGADGAC
jgi:putative DNA-invertase from lambdoid prophage Rac